MRGLHVFSRGLVANKGEHAKWNRLIFIQRDQTSVCFRSGKKSGGKRRHIKIRIVFFWWYKRATDLVSGAWFQWVHPLEAWSTSIVLINMMRFSCVFLTLHCFYIWSVFVVNAFVLVFCSMFLHLQHFCVVVFAFYFRMCFWSCSTFVSPGNCIHSLFHMDVFESKEFNTQ